MSFVMLGATTIFPWTRNCPVSQPPAAELTTRDVLEQIGRRLTLIEDDARTMSDTLHSKIDQVEQRLVGRIDEAVRQLHTRIDEVEQRLGARIDALAVHVDEVEQRLGARIDALVVHVDEVEQRLNARIDALQAEMNRRFYWMMGMFFAGWLSIMGTILLKG